MAWGNLQSALIVLGVVVLLFPVARTFVGDKIVEAADYAGLPLGKPRLGAFTAAPVSVGGETNMRFDASLGGSTENVELNIYEAYSKYPDTEPGQLYDNAVFSTGTGSMKPELRKLLQEKRVLSQVCPSDGDDYGCAEETGGKPIESYDKRPGWYKFTAALMPIAGKSKKSFDEKEVLVGLYSEEYVELLDKEISGCNDIRYGNCNVVECKKEIINVDFNDPLRVARGLRKPIVLDISKGFGCAGVKDVVETYRFELDGCSKEDIDKINTKMARARLLETANNEDSSISSEDDYKKRLDKLDFWKDQAVKMTMSCTQPLGGADPRYHWLNVPFGAYTKFSELGWESVGGFNAWEEKIKNELEIVLKTLRPAIASIMANANIGGDSKVTLGWALPIGKGTITKYELKLFYSTAAPKENKVSSVKKLPIGEFVVKQPGTNDLEVKYPETGVLPSDKMGTYWFSLTAFDKDGASDTKDSTTGIYDSSYIEQYRDLKGVDDACDGDCDVAGKKEAALGDNQFGWSNVPGKTKKPEETYVYIARCGDSVPRFKGDVTDCGDNGGKFSVSCQLDKSQKEGEKRITGCTEKEVNILYKDVLSAYAATVPPDGFQLGKTVADLLKFDCWTETWMKSYKRWSDDTGVWSVCEAKEDLYKHLVKLGWAYVAK